MGYCMSMTESEFKIQSMNFNNVVDAVKKLMDDFDPTEQRNDHYDWIDHEAVYRCIKWKDIRGVFAEWRYEVDLDKQWNIDSIDFTGEKLGDESKFFNAIAPYVESGSYIQMHGEDGDVWRWVFKNGKCTEKRAKLVFDDE